MASPFMSRDVAATVNPTVNPVVGSLDTASREIQETPFVPKNQLSRQDQLDRDIESLLVKSLLETSQGKIQQALDTTDELLKMAPNFKLAYLVRGDLLMARAQQFRGFGNSKTNLNENLEDFRQEALTRLRHYFDRDEPNGRPELLWKMDASQAYALIVDASKSRMYVYRNENGKPRYVDDYYVTLGKNGVQKRKEGDKRTPLGVYFSSVKLTEKLPDFYGDAAYPLQYPNEWDNRVGNSGYGIWIHGTPSDSYSRPPRASNGCVVVASPDLKELSPILQDGNTPVIIAEQVQWVVEEDQPIPEKEALQLAIEDWRSDWESQNIEQYLEHYSTNFFNRRFNYTSWVKNKRHVQTYTTHAAISLDKMSMYRYPDVNQPMVVVNFEQHFKSNLSENRTPKRQYWVLENQQWKILYEDSV